jgi:extracellular elastinolytic metalloproteinase
MRTLRLRRFTAPAAVPASVPAVALVALLAATLPATLSGAAASAAVPPADEGRNFDARVGHNLTFHAEPGPAQIAALDRLRSTLPDLLPSFDLTTGVTRSLYNPVGYLTEGASGDAAETALGFVRSHLDALGLSEADFESFEVADRVDSRLSASTHLYLHQIHQGIPVYGGQLQINVGRGGRLLSVNNAFVPDLATAVNTPQPMLSAAEAVESAMTHLGQPLLEAPELFGEDKGARRTTVLRSKTASLEPVTAQLFWLPIRRGDVRLVWGFQLHTLDRRHVYDITTDAVTGQVWTRFDWVASDS